MTASAPHTPESIDRDLLELRAICRRLCELTESYDDMMAGAYLDDATVQVSQAISRLDIARLALSKGGTR